MKRPLIILPLGPAAWASHQQIVPELLKVWRRLGCGFTIQAAPPIELGAKFIEECANASVLVFPIGVIHYDSLRILEQLRAQHRVDVPACIMHTSGIYFGAEYLHRYAKILKNTDHFVMNSSAEVALLNHMTDRSISRISSIGLPVDEDTFTAPSRAERQKLRRKLGFGAKEKVILYSGRISAQKNILSLLATFREVHRRQPDTRLVLVGQADDIDTPHVQNQNRRRYVHEISLVLQRLQLQDVVEFRAHVDQTRLAEYMKAADMHVSLTLHSSEDYGYGIAQGLACGTPTLITRWGGGLDLGKVAQSVDVLATFNGPRVDLRTASASIIRQLKKNPSRASTSSKFKRQFGRKKIEIEWRKLFESFSDKSQKENRPLKLRRKHSRTLRPFKRTELRFRDFMRIYSGDQQFLNKRDRFFLNPLFAIERGELLDPLSPQRFIVLTKREQKILNAIALNFGPMAVLSKGSHQSLGKSARNRLYDLGVLISTR